MASAGSQVASMLVDCLWITLLSVIANTVFFSLLYEKFPRLTLDFVYNSTSATRPFL